MRSPRTTHRSTSTNCGEKAITELSPGTTFRLLLHGPASGAYNMALDEALLESVSEGRSGPVVRLYAFAHGTVSTGRFQPVLQDFDLDLLASAGLTLVRRPSGGKAVLHNHELTYAVVLGKDHLERFSKRKVYSFIVPILLEGLRELGLSSAMNRETRGDLRNPDCFATSGEYEIDSAAGRKLIGSAQMLTRTAVLQHGSIPIASRERDLSPYLRPAGAALGTVTAAQEELHEASSIADELGREPAFLEVREAFARAARRLLPSAESELTAEEIRRVDELVSGKYSRSSWNLQQ